MTYRPNVKINLPPERRQCERCGADINWDYNYTPGRVARFCGTRCRVAAHRDSIKRVAGGTSKQRLLDVLAEVWSDYRCFSHELDRLVELVKRHG